MHLGPNGRGWWLCFSRLVRVGRGVGDGEGWYPYAEDPLGLTESDLITSHGLALLYRPYSGPDKVWRYRDSGIMPTIREKNESMASLDDLAHGWHRFWITSV